MRRSPWSRKRSNRGPVATLVTILVVAVIAVLAVLLEPAPSRITGSADAVDGDTLRLGATRVRLLGIDAPESEQTCSDREGVEWSCGKDAKAFLAELLKGTAIDCAGRGRDKYGRTLATCSVGSRDIGRSVVEAGWAVADLDYALAEAGARAAHRGIWRGTFEPPADFRRDHGAEPFDFFAWIRSWLK